MSLLSVGNSYYNATAANVKAEAVTAKVKEEAGKGTEKDNVSKPNVDKFVKSSQTQDTANFSGAKKLSSDQLKNLQDQQVASFKNMLSSMLTSQADKAQAAMGGLTISADLFNKLTVSPAQQMEAQQAISEDGAWGVNAVSSRIMDMAMALSGGDSSKAAVLRDAVEKGFKAAGSQWGSSLPSICDRTHDEINKRFDYWEKNGSLDGYEYKKAEE